MNRFLAASASFALIISAHNAVAGDAEIVEALLNTSAISCDDIGVEKELLMNVVAALRAEILSQVQQGKRVQLDDFGTFYLERTETRVKTGTKTQVTAQQVVRFEARKPASGTDAYPRVADVATNP